MKHFLYAFVILAICLTGCKSNSSQIKPAEEGDFSNTLTPKEISGGKVTPEILWKFGRISEQSLSPDGKTLVYTVKRYDAKTNKSHTWIYEIPTTGGNPVNLTADFASCENPRWVTNKTIAFLSPANDVSQIWTMNADGSEKKQLSFSDKDVNGFEFSKDGNKVFYLQQVKMDSTTQDKYPDLPLATGRIITDLMYRHWNQWSDYTYSHIFIAEINNGKLSAPIDILKGQPFDSPLSPYFDIAEIAWSRMEKFWHIHAKN